MVRGREAAAGGAWRGIEDGVAQEWIAYHAQGGWWSGRRRSGGGLICSCTDALGILELKKHRLAALINKI